MKKRVADQSGHCRHAGQHDACRGQWETPSAIVMCDCTCHGKRVMVPKGPAVQRRIVAKK